MPKSINFPLSITDPAASVLAPPPRFRQVAPGLVTVTKPPQDPGASGGHPWATPLMLAPPNQARGGPGPKAAHTGAQIPSRDLGAPEAAPAPHNGPFVPRRHPRLRRLLAYSGQPCWTPAQCPECWGRREPPR